MAHSDQRNLRESGNRIEQLLSDLRATPDPKVGEKVEDLVRLLVEMYGVGLSRMIEIVAADTASARMLMDRFAADELVASLLVLHDLHPVDTETRVGQALDKVRPYLGSHAGDVEFLGLDEGGVVHLRLQGSCHGCPASSLTVKLAIERAIMETAPEVNGIEVEGVAPRSERVISLDSLRRNAPSGTNGHGAEGPAPGTWVGVDHVGTLAVGAVAVIDVEGLPLVFCRSDEHLYAYGNRCPGCGDAWGVGTLHGGLLVCLGCGERYDVRQVGVNPNRPTLRLEPIPLLVEDGAVRVAIPGGVL